MSSMELPLTFGLGPTNRVEELLIRWPDGSEQSLVPEGVDRALVVEQTAEAPR
jgi:hypothetical protein